MKKPIGYIIKSREEKGMKWEITMTRIYTVEIDKDGYLDPASFYSYKEENDDSNIKYEQSKGRIEIFQSKSECLRVCKKLSSIFPFDYKPWPVFL